MGAELIIGIVAGGLVSWLVTHLYYQRSSTEVPEWAKLLIAKLPDSPVSPERLIQLYHEALDSGDLTPDPVSGYVACPKCGAQSSEFETQTAHDPKHDDTYYSRVCKKCGTEVWFEQQ